MAETTTRTGLRRLLRDVHEDWVTGERSWSRPGTHALVVYRVGRWGQTLPAPWSLLVKVVHRVLYNLVRVVHGIQLPLTVEVGRRLRIAHFGTVIVADHTRIGDDCLIRHNVTLGARDVGLRYEVPTLADHVHVGPGAVIIGRVTIGAGVKIAPNSVVTTDVPAGARVFPPAAEIRSARRAGAAAGRPPGERRPG